jgi:hypothetical protein
MPLDGRFFVPVSPRGVGRTFTAETLGQSGKPTGKFSNTIVDMLGSTITRIPDIISLGDSFDGQEVSLLGIGSPGQDFQEISYVNRTPVKFAFQEAEALVGIGGGLAGSISSTGRGSVDV